MIVAALDATCVRTMFPTIEKLMPKAEKIKKLQAICKNCNHTASFTFRTASKDVTEMIGGEDMYKPLCRECYIRESKVKEEIEGDLNSRDYVSSENNKVATKKSSLDVENNHSDESSIDTSPENSPEKCF